MEPEILRLLAALDIGKASFLLLAAILIWWMREHARLLRSIERLIGENVSVLRDVTGVLRLYESRREGKEERHVELS